MIGLLQRVRRASVEVERETVASIGHGLLVFVGIESSDCEDRAARLLQRLLNYRVFADDLGRMNRSLRDLGPDHGGLLLVPQFTLAADTQNGTRAGFSTAAPPSMARGLFEGLVALAETKWRGSQSGIFGADMQVSLLNDGPVTFLLRA